MVRPTLLLLLLLLLLQAVCRSSAFRSASLSVGRNDAVGGGNRWGRQPPSVVRSSGDDSVFEGIGDDQDEDGWVRIPLLDVLDESVADIAGGMVVPLPSSHLPAEISTPFLYGMRLDRPVHKMIMDEATSVSDNVYGHVVWKNEATGTYLGAIGCTAEVIVNTASENVGVEAPPTVDEAIQQAMEAKRQAQQQQQQQQQQEQDPNENTVLCRGGYRFIVRDVVQTVPYPVVRVEALRDDSDEEELVIPASATDDDDDEMDDTYNDLSTSELIQRVLLDMQALVKQKREEAESKRQMSPLEMSILEESGVSFNPADIEQMQAEEMAAVFDVFQASLIDLDISLEDRPYAVAFLAAEMADVDNDVRKELLLTRSPRERLQLVGRKLNEKVGMARAAKMASRITDATDEASKDLRVGRPSLPPWAKDIREGTRVEYFWSEQDGWFAGRVVEDPTMIGDEMIVTVLFDDGETHRLPLSPDEKVRWRPPRLGG